MARLACLLPLLPFVSLVAALPVETDAACAPPSIVTSTITAAAAAASACSVITTTVLATDVASVVASAAAAPSVTVGATSVVLAPATSAPAASGTNVQAFTGTLGGAPPPVVSGTGTRPFSVNGDTFVGVGAALGRSCDVQHNACARAANSGQLAGGVGQCDSQNAACHAANSLRRRWAPGADLPRRQPPTIGSLSSLTRRSTPLAPRADLGTCADTTILFEAGLDGRNTEAFIAADQTDFNHGSALNIAVIAGFICQRLASSCGAPADTVATCASASAAAVATTQNQAAADAFNSILGGAAVAATSTVAAAAAAATTAAVAATTAATDCGSDVVTVTMSAVVMTITSCA